jgi:hypothetical protein
MINLLVELVLYCAVINKLIIHFLDADDTDNADFFIY